MDSLGDTYTDILSHLSYYDIISFLKIKKHNKETMSIIDSEKEDKFIDYISINLKLIKKYIELSRKQSSWKLSNVAHLNIYLEIIKKHKKKIKQIRDLVSMCENIILDFIASSLEIDYSTLDRLDLEYNIGLLLENALKNIVSETHLNLFNSWRAINYVDRF